MVTTFASNAARISTLAAVAKETGRKFCIAGRSLDRILKVAKACGYLKDVPEPIDWDAAMRLPRDKVLIVATGGQGEPRAALARVADGTHPIQLDVGDTVIFSSKQIPGNEVAIGAIMNQLASKGIEMVTERQAHVHVSGHPGRPELAQMYKWIRPELLIPVHGEMRHMMEQARFGLSEGIPQTLGAEGRHDRADRAGAGGEDRPCGRRPAGAGWRRDPARGWQHDQRAPQDGAERPDFGRGGGVGRQGRGPSRSARARRTGRGRA